VLILINSVYEICFESVQKEPKNVKLDLNTKKPD
jgi:hypothetical protein